MTHTCCLLRKSHRRVFGDTGVGVGHGHFTRLSHMIILFLCKYSLLPPRYISDETVWNSGGTLYIHAFFSFTILRFKIIVSTSIPARERDRQSTFEPFQCVHTYVHPSYQVSSISCTFASDMESVDSSHFTGKSIHFSGNVFALFSLPWRKALLHIYIYIFLHSVGCIWVDTSGSLQAGRVDLQSQFQAKQSKAMHQGGVKLALHAWHRHIAWGVFGVNQSFFIIRGWRALTRFAIL